jgi:DNA modification methylase
LSTASVINEELTKSVASSVTTSSIQVVNIVDREETGIALPEETQPHVEDINDHINFKNMDFKDYFQTIKDELNEKVDVMVLDPPYHVLPSEKYTYSHQDKVDTVNMCHHLLKPKGYLVIFTSWQRAGEWETILINSKVFTVYKSNLVVVKECSNSMRQKGVSNMQNMSEMAVVAYKKGNGQLTFNYYGKQRYVKGSYNNGMSVIDNYKKPSEKLMLNGKTLRIEEKSHELYMELYSRFSNPETITVDLFAGSASSAYAALKLGMKWYGCEKDPIVFEAANERLQLRFKSMNKREGLRKINSTNSYKEELKKENSVPTSNYPSDILEYIDTDISSESILQFCCTDLKLEVKKTSLENLKNDEGLFANKDIDTGNQICTYWGIVLSEDDYNKRQNSKQISNRVVKISRKFKGKNYWIDGDISCPAVYINCAVDFHNGKTFEPNAELIQNPSLNDFDGLGSHDCLQVVATKDIKTGDEIFINYIQEKDFESVKKWFESPGNVIEMEGSKEVEEVINVEGMDSENVTVNQDSGSFENTEEFEQLKAKVNFLLVNIGLENSNLGTIGHQLWKRYISLGLLKHKSDGDKAYTALGLLPHISVSALKIVVQVLEKDVDLDYTKRRCFFIKLLEDNKENRDAVEVIRKIALNSKDKENITDKNYEGSEGRKLYKYKKADKFGFMQDFNSAMGVLWPGYTASEYQAVWTANNKCRRQGFHTDYNTFGKNNYIMAYAHMLSLDDSNYIWTCDFTTGKRVYTRHYYPFGWMCIFSGNYIHAGDEFTGENNFKLFRYLDSPNMYHGFIVTQIFNSFGVHTTELNLYM